MSDRCYRAAARAVRAISLASASLVLALMPAAEASAGGATVWASRYGGGRTGAAYSIAVSPDGSKVYVTGRSGSSVAPDYGTVAYDTATGGQLWVHRYDGPGHGFDVATSIVASPDGSKVIVTGRSYGAAGTSDYATIAYAASTGDKLWVARYKGPDDADDRATDLVVSGDGSKVFVTGGSDGTTGGRDYATVAYDASTGARVWAKRYNGSGDDFDEASAVAISGDGSRVFVTGESFGAGGTDYATVAYVASTGARLWVKRYDGPAGGGDAATAAASSPDGSTVFVTGYGHGIDTHQDFATVAYDGATGATLWVRRYDGPGTGPSEELPYSLAVSPDGSSLFVTGESVPANEDSDFATVSYDAATGDTLWVKRYDGFGQIDFGMAIATSPEGSKVFVTGYSEATAGNSDYGTVAYDAASGATLWAKRYDGGGPDRAHAVAVSVDGSSVFVTGESRAGNTANDYATVAYSVEPS